MASRSKLMIVDVGDANGRLRECVVKCLEGTVRVGDWLCPSRHPDTSCEVLELRYFSHLVDELECNFGGLALLAGPAVEDIQRGETLILC